MIIGENKLRLKNTLKNEENLSRDIVGNKVCVTSMNNDPMVIIWFNKIGKCESIPKYLFQKLILNKVNGK